MSRFFVHHPIFAWVIALLIMLGGTISLVNMPISQYPSVASPSITIQTTYRGASAQTVEETVTQVIEQNMKGLDNLLYMRSTSSSNGQAEIKLTFALGTDPDIAQVQVQNKLQLATSSLPQTVQEYGLTVSKGMSGLFLGVGLTSIDGSIPQEDLSDYVNSSMKDDLSRVTGVGDVMVFGGEYAMRIWLDPDKLAKYKMTAQDIVGALKSQNVQVAAGQLAAGPTAGLPQFNVTVTVQSLMQTPDEFENILLRVESTGESVFLRDVARVEIGSNNYSAEARINGKPGSGMSLSLASGANALSTATRVKEKLEEMKPSLPDNMEIVIFMDTTPPIMASVEEVTKTLAEAIGLVFLVMLVFLQNFRATLIPTIAVPVVLLGTFGVLSVFGFGLNTLTLFAMVLAIGLLVDDAIVVVENVERVMHEEHLSAVEATEKSMGQISGALVGIAVVLSAVFIPMAFMSGSTGVIYRQFSVTIVSAMVLSVIVALILTPALCATMLKDIDHNAKQTGFAGWFNRMFDRSTNAYFGGIKGLVKRSGRLLIVYVAILAGLGYQYVKLPTSYLPMEDQGIVFTMIQLPANTTQDKTLAVIKEVEDYVRTHEKDVVDTIMSVEGFSFSGYGQNVGMMFISLTDWSQRPLPSQTAEAVAGRLRQAFGGMLDAVVMPFLPPAIIEMGTSGGFTMELQDKAGLGHEAMINARGRLLGSANQNPVLAYARSGGMDDTAQFAINIDKQLAASQSLDLSSISSVLGTMLGGAYVNDFVDRGRTKKVFVQADAPFRMTPEDLKSWHFRNNLGEMVPFDSIAKTNWTTGPALLERYNGFPSMEILGEPRPGISSGIAMAAMEEEVAKLGPGYGVEWSSMSYEERLSGSQTMMLYGLAALVVFLALAALYESWSVPFSVILVVPLGIFGAVMGTSYFGLSNDVYFQVGILATMGLSAKNAILVVEFAKSLREKGASLREAAAEAARLRLRPILMTSLAFGLGVVPLMTSSGSGAASQHAVGTAVFFGTVFATALGIFFIPVFYVVVSGVSDFLFRRKKKAAKV